MFLVLLLSLVFPSPAFSATCFDLSIASFATSLQVPPEQTTTVREQILRAFDQNGIKRTDFISIETHRTDPDELGFRSDESAIDLRSTGKIDALRYGEVTHEIKVVLQDGRYILMEIDYYDPEGYERQNQPRLGG